MRLLRSTRESGHVAVEAALVTPFVIALMVGIIEFGFLFKDYLAATGSVRAGVRIASAESRNSGYAQDAAEQVAAVSGGIDRGNIRDLWVYKAQVGNDLPHGSSDFTSCTTCVRFRWDAATGGFVKTYDGWAAASQSACGRQVDGIGPDRVGVFIRVEHEPFTGIAFSDPIMIEESSVLNFEPLSVITGCKP
jgi:hypothetical protein